MLSKKKLLFIIVIIIIISSIINAKGFITYLVKKGDNLTDIAEHFNVAIDEIISLNNIKNPDIIYVNQKIKIPKEKIQTYKIQSGDTLWDIAEQFKVTIKNLINTNNIINPDNILVGQDIIIPTNEPATRTQLASRSQKINYIWPVLGRISSQYGWRDHPIHRKRLFHTGIDIAVPFGTPVYAAEDGIVEFSGWSDGYGNLIIIRHRDNSRTYYGHNLRLLVEEGENLQQGKLIAFSGNSGISTGPHLHFEIRINNNHTDPLRYLNIKYLENNLRR